MRLTCRVSPTVALSHHVKVRELSTSGVIFAVSRCECFVGNKNIKERSVAINLKKNITEFQQNFTSSYKKSLEALDEVQDTHNIIM